MKNEQAERAFIIYRDLPFSQKFSCIRAKISTGFMMKKVVLEKSTFFAGK